MFNERQYKNKQIKANDKIATISSKINVKNIKSTNHKTIINLLYITIQKTIKDKIYLGSIILIIIHQAII